MSDAPSTQRSVVNVQTEYELEYEEPFFELLSYSNFVESDTMSLITFMGLFNRKSDCKECELVLKMSTCSSSQLIDGKDRGGLVTPSDDIDQIVTFLMRNENFKYLF